jgi:hypothetical protein
MILPDGYSDVPAGKIAAVVTHLEMIERPAVRPDPAGGWSLRRVEMPPLDWFRDLYLRVGEEVVVVFADQDAGRGTGGTASFAAA